MSTRSRSSGDSWSGRLYAFDTVVRDTFNSAAIDANVAGRLGSLDLDILGR